MNNTTTNPKISRENAYSNGCVGSKVKPDAWIIYTMPPLGTKLKNKIMN